MKKDQVQVGGTYMAKVSGGVVPVQIREERWVGEAHKGWTGVNTQSGRPVTIKSAQRLRRLAGEKPAVAGNSGEVAPGGGEAPTAVVAAGSPVPPTGGKPAAKKAVKAGKPANAKADSKPAKGAKPAKETKPPKGPPSKLSGLDAAAKVLADAKKSMNCKEIVAEAYKKNLWKSEGATPEATIYAAIIREISAKGGDARFKKTERGQFAAAGKGP